MLEIPPEYDLNDTVYDVGTEMHLVETGDKAAVRLGCSVDDDRGCQDVGSWASVCRGVCYTTCWSPLLLTCRREDVVVFGSCITWTMCRPCSGDT